MEEYDVGCLPLFGDSSCDYYNIKSANRSVMSKTRSVTNVKCAEGSANDLFADNLWPGCYVLSDILDSNPYLCRSKSVLELGAGSALPSLVASVLGASIVVTSDYPEPSVIQNIEEVCKSNNLNDIIVEPYAWGGTTEPLLSHLCSTEGTTNKFDLILCAELLWKDTYIKHEDLLKSIAYSLDENVGIAIVTFVHRPTECHSPTQDLEFFEKAKRLYRMQYKHMGICRKYKDCLDDSDDYAAVQVYVLYFHADVSHIPVLNNLI